MKKKIFFDNFLRGLAQNQKLVYNVLSSVREE